MRVNCKNPKCMWVVLQTMHSTRTSFKNNPNFLSPIIHQYFQIDCSQLTSMDLARESEDINEGEAILLSCGNDEENVCNNINEPLCDSLERLNSAKRELAVKLREIVSLKRRLDDVPTQAELIQYEHRSSELYAHIQEKLGKTRKLYATFNALLEIKDLMLKETSLLNSINLQFQDAIATPACRLKLIDSMDGIMNGTQQKLDKVQLALELEKKACDDVKATYTAAITGQRSCYALLKAFQEECAKNERLRKPSLDELP